jgi:hypothetical protein
LTLARPWPTTRPARLLLVAFDLWDSCFDRLRLGRLDGLVLRAFALDRLSLFGSTLFAAFPFPAPASASSATPPALAAAIAFAIVGARPVRLLALIARLLFLFLRLLVLDLVLLVLFDKQVLFFVDRGSDRLEARAMQRRRPE